jgi:hypothetical protein
MKSVSTQDVLSCGGWLLSGISTSWLAMKHTSLPGRWLERVCHFPRSIREIVILCHAAHSSVVGFFINEPGMAQGETSTPRALS